MIRKIRKINNLFDFTLVELIIVTVVIAVMAAMLLPALNNAQEDAESNLCKNNLKQLDQAFLQYADSNDGWSITCDGESYNPDITGWHIQLSKQLGVWQGVTETEVLLCPSLGGWTGNNFWNTHYGMNRIFWGWSNKDTSNKSISSIKLSQVSAAAKRMVLADSIPVGYGIKLGLTMKEGGYRFDNKNYIVKKTCLPGKQDEVWTGMHIRHGNDDAVNIAFGDGHVSLTAFSIFNDTNLGKNEQSTNEIWGWYSDAGYHFPPHNACWTT